MKISCDLLANPDDSALCRFLADAGLVEESRLDAGHEGFRAAGDRFVRETRGVGDGRIVPEFYDRLIPLAEKNRDVFQRVKASVSAPWSPFQLQGPEGEALRRWIDRTGTRLTGSVLERAKDLFRSLIAPRSRGGLGLGFDKEETGPARGVLDVYRDRKANCAEFVAFYLMAADRLGIPVVPVELFFDESGNPAEHLRIGISDPQSGGIAHVADIAGRFFGPLSPREVWTPLTRREFLSYYANLRAAREKDPARAEAEIDFALSINPGNYLLLANKAHCLADRGEDRRALQILLKSIAHNPRYPFAYRMLQRVGARLGETDLNIHP